MVFISRTITDQMDRCYLTLNWAWSGNILIDKCPYTQGYAIHSSLISGSIFGYKFYIVLLGLGSSRELTEADISYSNSFKRPDFWWPGAYSSQHCKTVIMKCKIILQCVFFVQSGWIQLRHHFYHAFTQYHYTIVTNCPWFTKEVTLCIMYKLKEHSEINTLNFHKIRYVCILIMVLDVWTEPWKE